MGTPRIAGRLGNLKSVMAKKGEQQRKRASRWALIGGSTIAVLATTGIVGGALYYNEEYALSVDQPASAPAAAPITGPSTEGLVPNVAAVAAGPASNPALGHLAAEVRDAHTGEVVFSQGADEALVPASATKILTAAAAIMALGDETRLQTEVLDGSQPGEIVVRGGGDITLAANSDQAFYTDAPTIDNLVAQVNDARAQRGAGPVTRVVVDNSLTAGNSFNSTWDRADIGAGNVTELDSVMLNGGRLNPQEHDSPRTPTPAQTVGDAVASALGTNPEVVVASEAVAAGDVLATVQSAPLQVLVRDMLIHSDNMMAEALGRQIAIATGAPHTFAGATDATISVLHDAGFALPGVALTDNSGMSGDNRITPAALDQVLLTAVTAGAQRPSGPVADTDDPAQRERRLGELSDITDALPIASGTGTLTSRFGPSTAAAPGAGWVRAKTGTLNGVSALAGTVLTSHGRVLTFAFMSNGSEISAARNALDELAASLVDAQ